MHRVDRNETHPRRRANVRAVASIALAVAIGSLPVAHSAQPGTDAPHAARPATAGQAPAQQERAFWLCDYASTHRAFDTGDAMGCSTITEALKREKFGGNLDAMLAWWRQGRSAAHRMLEAAGAAAPTAPAAALR